MLDLAELKEKASLALKDVRFVEIVRDAPLSNRGKVNLSHINKEGFDYALEATGSTQRAHELSKSARALGELRRDFEGEFNVTAEEAFKSARERKAGESSQEEEPSYTPVESVEFPLPGGTDVIIGNSAYDQYRRIRFGNYDVKRGYFFAFLGKLIESLLEDDFNRYERFVSPPSKASSPEDLRDLAIRLLVEKFGMKVGYNFKRDMYEEADWELVEDVAGPDEISINDFDIVSFSALKHHKMELAGKDMIPWARSMGATLGQRQAEYLLDHQKEIPSEWVVPYACFVFPGTIWRSGSTGNRYVPCIRCTPKEWELFFHPLDGNDGNFASSWLMHPRTSTGS